MTNRGKQSTVVMILAGLLCSGAGAGCASGDARRDNAALGAAMGGVAGALIGSHAAGKGKRNEGTAIGAVAGAAGGALIGYKYGEGVEREKGEKANAERRLGDQVARAAADRKRLEARNADLERDIARLRGEYAAATSDAARRRQVKAEADRLYRGAEADRVAIEREIAAYQQSLASSPGDTVAPGLRDEVNALQQERDRLVSRRDQMAQIANG